MERDERAEVAHFAVERVAHVPVVGVDTVVHYRLSFVTLVVPPVGTRASEKGFQSWILVARER